MDVGLGWQSCLQPETVFALVFGGALLGLLILVVDFKTHWFLKDF